MITKLSQLKALWAAGDRPGALRMAAKWPRLGCHDDIIRKGASAAANPQFYDDMGHDVDALIAAAYAALITRYKLQGD